MILFALALTNFACTNSSTTIEADVRSVPSSEMKKSGTIKTGDVPLQKNASYERYSMQVSDEKLGA